MTDVPVHVDLAAAAARPTPDAVAGWAADQRVFVSSVMGGMTAERRAVVAGIEQVGAQPVWFEGFGGRDDDAELAYLSEVASSTVYVGILGRTYGRLQKSRRSATHDEYREAERRGLRIRAYVAPTATCKATRRRFWTRSGSSTSPVPTPIPRT